MNYLIPVQYHNRRYPPGISPTISEIAGHFDATPRLVSGDYSLHTEFSYGYRSFKSPAAQGLYVLREAQFGGVPQLWKSVEWAKDFSRYIQAFAGSHPPKVIEIHPPFADYSSLTRFIDVYGVFEAEILSVFPGVQILVENRNGTNYACPGFILNRAEDLTTFSKLLDGSGLLLKITLDLPQLITAHGLRKSRTAEMVQILEDMKSIRHNIYGIHLWGKKDRSAHSGDLNSFFRGSQEIKRLFLETLLDCFDDDFPRYFVPEVNDCDKSLHSIVNDLKDTGFVFV